jgi:hypothetical protein
LSYGTANLERYWHANLLDGKALLVRMTWPCNTRQEICTLICSIIVQFGNVKDIRDVLTTCVLFRYNV